MQYLFTFNDGKSPDDPEDLSFEDLEAGYEDTKQWEDDGYTIDHAGRREIVLQAIDRFILYKEAQHA